MVYDKIGFDDITSDFECIFRMYWPNFVKYTRTSKVKINPDKSGPFYPLQPGHEWGYIHLLWLK